MAITYDPYTKDVKPPLVDQDLIPESAISRIQRMRDAPLRTSAYEKTPALVSRPDAPASALAPAPDSAIQPSDAFAGPSRAYQKSWVGEQGSGMSKTVDESGKTSYEGFGSGVSSDQQARDVEMQSRGMVKGTSGNWEPKGGWEMDALRKKNPNDLTFSEAVDLGAYNKAGIAQQGRDVAQRELALRERAPGETRAFEAPLQTANIKHLGAQTAGLEAQHAQQGRIDEGHVHLQNLAKAGKGPGNPEYDQALAHLRFLMNPKGPEEEAARKEKILAAGINTGEPDFMAYGKKYIGMPDKKAAGGLIQGFALGGGVDAAPVDPLVAQYGQYLSEAAKAGIPPVPMEQYASLVQSGRGLPQKRFADGGDVSALSRELRGPGTETSDSIPAVIDGHKPAALSKGEFVVDAETVKHFGTKFFKELQKKAREYDTSETGVA